MLIARSTKKIVLLIFLSACGIISCTKNNNSSNGNGGASNDSTAAALSVSSASADNAYNDVLQVALETGFDNSIAYMVSNRGQGRVEENSVNTPATPLGLYTCANYTVSPNDTTTFPKTITIDFGVGCTSPDGIFRMGTITCVYSGKVLYPGTTVSVSFSNYSVNGYGLQGTYSIINNSSLAKGISFSTQVLRSRIQLIIPISEQKQLRRPQGSRLRPILQMTCIALREIIISIAPPQEIAFWIPSLPRLPRPKHADIYLPA